MTIVNQDASFDEDATRTMIRQLVLELAPAETVGEIRRDHRLVEDLEYHSLALMELAFTLEDEFALDPILEEDAQKITTVGDIEDYVVIELAAKAKRGAEPSRE